MRDDRILEEVNGLFSCPIMASNRNPWEEDQIFLDDPAIQADGNMISTGIAKMFTGSELRIITLESKLYRSFLECGPGMGSGSRPEVSGMEIC